jgi:hypothetical protein
MQNLVVRTGKRSLVAVYASQRHFALMADKNDLVLNVHRRYYVFMKAEKLCVVNAKEMQYVWFMIR